MRKTPYVGACTFRSWRFFEPPFFIDALTVRKRATVWQPFRELGAAGGGVSTPRGNRMKSTIRISVGIAALISAAALAHAQTERPSPQGDANYESRTLGQDRATEAEPSLPGPEDRAAPAERLAQPGQTPEERKAPVTVPGTEEQGAGRGMKQGAEQKGIQGEPRTGAIEEHGANPQGRAAEQRLQQGQRPYAQQRAMPGAQQRGALPQGQATPVHPADRRRASS